jgi:hypothetical protein
MYILVCSPYYNLTVLILIVANSIILSLDGYPKNPHKTEILEAMNVFFTWAFALEIFFKMTGLGIKNYVKDNSNLFDFLVSALSIIDFAITQTLSKEQIDKFGVGINAIRAARLLNVFKLSRKMKKF